MKHMLSSALFAGFVAGLLCALLQYLLVEPDILLSERYEASELVHFQGLATHSHDAAEPAPDATEPATEQMDHGHPAGGTQQSEVMRHGLTVLFSILTYCGYALVMLSAVRLTETSGGRLNRAQALLWGLAGFACFQMMPALGLPPQLPGTPGADITERQIWWAGTAVATAIGLWLMAYGSALWQTVVGAGMLALPHVWGAPQADGFGGAAPPELAAAFAAHTLGVGLITWLVLGVLVVYFWHSEPAK